MLIDEKISRWLSRRDACVSRNQGKIAPSRACTWFENKRFDWPSVSFPFATFLSINLISSFCSQFQLSALISSFCTQEFQGFALFGINWHALSQSAWRNFFMYVITPETPACAKSLEEEQIQFKRNLSSLTCTIKDQIISDKSEFPNWVEIIPLKLLHTL